MAKPKSAPTAQRFEPPEATPLLGGFDPFAAARQFDQMRQGATQITPFEMPVPQPKPIEFGGQMPGPARAAPLPAAGAAARPGAKPAAAGGNWGAMDWGNKTKTLEQNFPGLRHTSGYRDPEHNRRVGGAARSYHMQKDANGNARANDWVGTPREMQSAAAWAKANGAKEVLIHNVGSGQHLHVAW